MSTVVLRCPNCGTTQSTPGECDACHDAQVRYYCTNHSPGQWLDASACPQCGARFGVAAPPRREPPPPPRSVPRPPSASPVRRPAPPPPGPGPSPWSRTAPPPSRETREDLAGPGRDDLRTRWPDLIRNARLRRIPDGRRDDRAGAPIAVLPGCFGRALMLAFFFIALLVAMALFSGGPLLEILIRVLLSA